MHKLFRVTLSLVAAAIAVPTSIANATNIQLLPLSSGASPLTIAMTDRTAHLLDFSGSDRTVTGVWVDDPQEFARSFKVESIDNDPQMVAFTGVSGGSSKFTINLFTVDASGNRYIQPINLVKRVSERNITRFVDRAESTSIPTQEPSTTATPPATSPQTSAGLLTDLERGAIVAKSMSALVDPQLHSRVAELIAAVKSGRDLAGAADSIGVSPRYVAKLIELGKTSQTIPGTTPPSNMAAPAGIPVPPIETSVP